MNYNEFKEEYLKLLKNLYYCKSSDEAKVLTLSLEALLNGFPDEWPDSLESESLQVLTGLES